MLTRFTRALRAPALISLLAAATMAYVPCSSADSNPVFGADNGWDVRTSAYLWMVGIDGTQTVKGQEAELEVNFSDILDIMDFAGEGHVEAIKDKQWGFFIDGTYLKLGPEAGKGPIDIRIGYKYWLWELAGVYRAKTWATNSGGAAVDLLLGVRYTSMDVDLDFQNLPLPNLSGGQSWTDLIVGARLVADLPQDWSVVLRGDVGGFGIGGSSDLSLQGSLIFRWDFKPNWGLGIGYRALKQDYSKGRGTYKFAYDATTHGPLLGLEYRF